MLLFSDKPNHPLFFSLSFAQCSEAALNEERYSISHAIPTTGVQVGTAKSAEFIL